MTILDAMRDPALFGPWFDPASWRAWSAFLAALFALPMSDADVDVFRQCTGRTTPPKSPAREAWVVVGRRGGKSRIAAAIAVYLACFADHRANLAPGEVGTVALIAADRRQARTLMRYIAGFFDAVPMLGQMVTGRTKESITLANRIVIEVHTASFRSVRGYTLVAVIADEIAFWMSDEAGANPDVEIINGLRPGLATTGGLLLAISSPYARRGVLWNAHRRHFGVDDDPVLVWQAPTDVMNPRVDRQVIADAYAEDEASAAAEYGAAFRRDVETFISRETVQACVVPGRIELPPTLAHRHVAFTDAAGGSGQDSFTLAIAHAERGAGEGAAPRVVVDALREVKPPFSPDDVVRDFVALLRRYGIASVHGDRYAGDWVAERFRRYGIDYQPSAQTKSDLYRDLLPVLNSGQVELLDAPRLLAQLTALERRVARGGRESIDHPPRGHDDVANALAGVCAVARWREQHLVRLVDGGI